VNPGSTPVKVFGEHATTGIDIGLHSIDRVWSRYEGPPASGGGIARASLPPQLRRMTSYWFR